MIVPANKASLRSISISSLPRRGDKRYLTREASVTSIIKEICAARDDYCLRADQKNPECAKVLHDGGPFFGLHLCLEEAQNLGLGIAGGPGAIADKIAKVAMHRDRHVEGMCGIGINPDLKITPPCIKTLAGAGRDPVIQCAAQDKQR